MTWRLAPFALALLQLECGTSFTSIQPSLYPISSSSTFVKMSTSSAYTMEDAVNAAWRQLFAEHDNDAMNVLFCPAANEAPDPIPLLGLGAKNPLPVDLPPGVLLRNGPNPQPGHECSSFLDGDGMVHAITLPPQNSDVGEKVDGNKQHFVPSYSRTWIRSAGFAKEEAAGGQQLFRGTLVAPRGYPMLAHLVSNAFKTRGQVQKDTVNTALSNHAGRVLALMEQSRPSELRVSQDGRVRTIAADSSLDGAITPVPVLGGALSAHSRIDPSNGDLVTVSYSTATAPYLRLDVFGGVDGSLKISRGIDTPAPIMVHDCAITQSHAILLDLPMTVRLERTLMDRFPVEYEPSAGARIGITDRLFSGKAHSRLSPEVQWAAVKPCVVLHTANAFEEHVGPPSSSRLRVTLTALRSQPQSPQSYICSYTPAFLYKWVLEFDNEAESDKGRCVEEGYMSALPIEFPMVNPLLHGSPDCKFVWAITPCSAGGPLAHGYNTPQQGILIDGIVQMNIRTGEILSRWQSPALMTEDGTPEIEREYVVSEPTIVPKVGATDEDEAYILLIVSTILSRESSKSDDQSSDNRNIKAACVGSHYADRSKLHIFDAKDISKGPVASLSLPDSVPYGLHSTYVPWDELDTC